VVAGPLQVKFKKLAQLLVSWGCWLDGRRAFLA
jgi:hypothetical protein